MNVLFVDQFSDLGGAQQCLLDLAPAIQAEGWKMTCAVPGTGSLVTRLGELGITVSTLPMTVLTSGRKHPLDFLRFSLDAPKLARDIGHLAAEFRADLIYVNGPRVLPTAAWVARRTGRPMVFHCHNYLGQRPPAILAGRSLQFARARVIACCRYVARPLWPFIDPGRMHVIYNGSAQTVGAGSAQSSPRRIGMIGRVSPEKGQVEFVQAVRLLTRKHTDCSFLICGAPLFSDRAAEQYFERVRESARDLPVEFSGWQQDVSSTLAQLDMLVVPSLREPGAPRVVLEAFAARVPVVAFVSGGIPEIVINNATGFLVEPPTADALAAKLEALLHAPGELRAVAGRAYETWKEKFTLERYRREVLAVMGLTQTLSATGRCS